MVGDFILEQIKIFNATPLTSVFGDVAQRGNVTSSNVDKSVPFSNLFLYFEYHFLRSVEIFKAIKSM